MDSLKPTLISGHDLSRLKWEYEVERTSWLSYDSG